jgi:hypothetical protein
MENRIRSLTSDLTAISDDASRRFGGLSGAQLNWKPSPTSWSVAQCFDHLITTHNLYVPVLHRLRSGNAPASFWERHSPLSGFFGRFLIKSLDPDNQKKMKAPSKAAPSASAIDAGIIERYRAHVSEIIDCLNALPPGIDPATTIITSPLASVVTYSLDDSFTILVVHGRRHFGQAERVTQTEGFPAS